MKVLSLLWGFSPGGIGKCAVTYDRLGKMPDINFHTACIHRAREKCDLTPLKKISATLIPIKRRIDLSWIRKSKALIDEYKPDVLFVHGFNGPVVAKILQWKLKRKIPFVCSYHGKYHAPTAAKKILEPIYNFVQERIYKSSAFRVLTCADHCSNHLISKGVPAEKITVVHNGIERSVPECKVVLRNDLGIGEDDIVFGTVSRIDPVKGIRYLFDAFTEISGADKRVHLVLVGDGPLTDDLKKQAKNKHIDTSVHFVGYQDNIPAWLDLFDIFVSPSLAEYHSIALMEAMRAGKAIIATDVGGNTESVRDGKEALIVPSANSQALANALKTMIADSQLRQHLGKAARQRFETEFTEDKMLEKLAEWLHAFEKQLDSKG